MFEARRAILRQDVELLQHEVVKSTNGAEMKILALDSTPAEFAQKILQTSKDSVSNSWVRLSQRRSPGANTSKTFRMDLEAIDWDNYQAWPQHRVEVTSYIVDGVDKDKTKWNTVTRLVRFRPFPFAKGAMRYAFPVVEEASQTKLVAKIYQFDGAWWQSLGTLEKDAHSQAYGRFFAEQFSKRVPDMAVQFLQSSLMKVSDGSQKNRNLELSLVEHYIPGIYEKYTNNGSWVAQDSNVAQALLARQFDGN